MIGCVACWRWFAVFVNVGVKVKAGANVGAFLRLKVLDYDLVADTLQVRVGGVAHAKFSTY